MKPSDPTTPSAPHITLVKALQQAQYYAVALKVELNRGIIVGEYLEEAVMNTDITLFATLSEKKDQLANEILSKPGVTGIAIGHKIKGDKIQKELCIIVYVEKKIPRKKLSADQIIDIPGVLFDIQEAGPMVAQLLRVKPIDVTAKNSNTYNPLIGGAEIGATGDSYVGTLGAVVYNHSNGNLVGLTNYHVAAGTSATPVGRNISQPGNSAANIIGSCIRATRGNVQTGSIDAAVIMINNRQATPLQIDGIGSILGMAQPQLQWGVIKRGRTTDITTGIISSLNWTGYVKDEADGSNILFSNQIFISPAPGVPAADLAGDSGAIWLANPGHAAVGLNFAGDGTNAIANPIFAVVETMGIQFESNRFAFYRWFNPATGNHFYTCDPGGEVASIGCIYEGCRQALFDASEYSAVALYRWYNGRDHFYTTAANGELAPENGYHLECVAGYIRMQPATGLTQFYRWVNGLQDDHFYTTDPNGEAAAANGYRLEGAIGWVTPL
jgi:hypothetical protein